MQVICPNCNSKLEISDERLPIGKRVAVLCPKCNFKMSIIREAQGDQALSPPIKEEGKITPPSIEWELDNYQEGFEYAMVLVQSNESVNKISPPLQELGYKIHLETSPETGVSRLKVYKFSIIVLEDGYKGFSLKQNPVMEYLNQLSMMVRRKMFVVAIGSNFKTADPMLAYSLSVELVINTNDLDSFYDLVKTTIKAKETFYRPFFEVMQEIGKV
mgnify:CR=1 FL=1